MMGNLLKNKFADFEPEPEQDLWPEIEASLRASKPLGSSALVNSFPLRKWLSIAAVLTIGIGLGWVFWGNSSPEQNHPVATTHTPPTEIRPVESIPTNPPVEAPQTPETSTQTPVLTVAHPHPTPKKTSSNVKNIRKETKVYMVEVTNTYDDNGSSTSTQQPIATAVVKEEVKQPIAVIPANSQHETTQVVPLNTPEAVERIIYELPSKKKRHTEKATPALTQEDVLNLNRPKGNEIAAFASQKINQVINTPVSIQHAKNGNEESTSYLVDLKFLKVQYSNHKKQKQK